MIKVSVSWLNAALRNFLLGPRKAGSQCVHEPKSVSSALPLPGVFLKSQLSTTPPPAPCCGPHSLCSGFSSGTLPNPRSICGQSAALRPPLLAPPFLSYHLSPGVALSSLFPAHQSLQKALKEQKFMFVNEVN